MSFVIGGGSTAANQFGTTAATDYLDAMQKLAAFLDRNNFHVATVAIAAGGSGYAVGDVVSLDAGTPLLSMRATFRVTAEAGGVATAIEPASMGCYAATPAGSGLATTAEVGSGSGLTVDTTAGTNAYTLERDELVDGGPERELIVRADGLDGNQSIYWGLQSHRNAAADFYNIKIAGFSGFEAGLGFLLQPGSDLVDGDPAVADLPLWNTTLPFWFYVNDQRVFVVFRPATVYIQGYMGYGVPSGPLTAYPYPLTWWGMAAGPDRLTQALRYSQSNGQLSNAVTPAFGACYIKWLGGTGLPVAGNVGGDGSSLNTSVNRVKSYPATSLTGSTNKSVNGVPIDADDILASTRDTNGERPFLPIEFWDGGSNQDFFNSSAITLDRVRAVPGFGLSSEGEVFDRDGRKYRVFQNGFRTDRGSFVAVEEV